MVWILLFLDSANNSLLCFLSWLSWESASCFRGFGKNHRMPQILIYAVNTKYTLCMEFSPVALCERLESFPKSAGNTRCLFVRKFPETASFNLPTWVVYIWVSHWILYPAFSLICSCKTFALMYKGPCLPPTPASVLPLDLGRWICCSGLLNQRFDCSHLRAVSLPIEFVTPVLRPMSKFQRYRNCPPNRHRVYWIWIGISVLSISQRADCARDCDKGKLLLWTELYIRATMQPKLEPGFLGQGCGLECISCKHVLV